MGDPKKQKKKYSRPKHPWKKERIEQETELAKQYGLRRKNEIWKMNSFLRNMLIRAKTIIGSSTKQSEIEKLQLLRKAHSLGLIEKNSKIEDVLNINVKNVMDRRLQTLLVKKSMAKTMEQARQFIVHGHINVGDKKITSPSYLVNIAEESRMAFYGSSPLSSAEHAERAPKKEAPKKAAKEKKEEAKEEKQEVKK